MLTSDADVSTLRDRVSAILVERLHIVVPTAETDLLQAGILDSLQLVDLIFILEQEFAIRIPLDTLDLESFRSITTIADLVQSQKR
jgi:acyl carrier protein